MIVETIENIKEFIREFEDHPDMVSNKITYQNGDVLEIIKGVDQS